MAIDQPDVGSQWLALIAQNRRKTQIRGKFD
jgi:hypothetical protein